MKSPHRPIPSPPAGYPAGYEFFLRSDGEYSEFPPARVHESTPDQPSPPPASRELQLRLKTSPVLKRLLENRRLLLSPDLPQPSQWRGRLSSSPDLPQPSLESRHSSSQRPKQGLKSNNISNTVKVRYESSTILFIKSSWEGFKILFEARSRHSWCFRT